MNSPHCNKCRCNTCVFHDECDNKPQNKKIGVKL
jgi:hypothetical protein